MQIMLSALLALASMEIPPADDPATTATADGLNQHIAVIVLSAMYYCENQRWPENIEAVRVFQEKIDFPVPVKPDWAMLGADASIYSLDRDKLTVTTGVDAIAGAYKVTSTNRPPGCSGSKLKVNTAMHFGE